jgi:hypothetical protein
MINGTLPRSLLVWIEFSEQVYVIREFLICWVGKLKSNPVTFLDAPTINHIGFPKPAYPLFVIVAMLTVAILSNKNILNMGWGAFDKFTMFINRIEEKAKNNARFPYVNPSEDLIALDPRFPIDEHILSPTISVTDFAAKIISKLTHLSVECVHKPLINFGDKVKSVFVQKITHYSILNNPDSHCLAVELGLRGSSARRRHLAE